MAGSEPLIQEADPRITKLALGAPMSDNMVQKNKTLKFKSKSNRICLSFTQSISCDLAAVGPILLIISDERKRKFSRILKLLKQNLKLVVIRNNFLIKLR